MRGLAVSRAFGDIDWKIPMPLVDSSPEVRSCRLRSDDEFVIIGCDGVWDVMCVFLLAFRRASHERKHAHRLSIPPPVPPPSLYLAHLIDSEDSIHKPRGVPCLPFAPPLARPCLTRPACHL